MNIFSGYTHIGIGLTIWMFFPSLNLPFLIFGCLFPDSDHKKAAMGRIIPLWFFGFKHRSITHKFWFVIILAVLMDLYLIKGIGWPFLIGCISHIISDVISTRKK